MKLPGSLSVFSSSIKAGEREGASSSLCPSGQPFSISLSSPALLYLSPLSSSPSSPPSSFSTSSELPEASAPAWSTQVKVTIYTGLLSEISTNRCDISEGPPFNSWSHLPLHTQAPVSILPPDHQQDPEAQLKAPRRGTSSAGLWCPHHEWHCLASLGLCWAHISPWPACAPKPWTPQGWAVCYTCNSPRRLVWGKCLRQASWRKQWVTFWPVTAYSVVGGLW